MLDVSQTDLFSFQTDERSIPSDGENAGSGRFDAATLTFFEAGGKSSVLLDIEVKVFEPRDATKKKGGPKSQERWTNGHRDVR